MSTFQQQLIGALPAPIRDFLEGGPRRELLKKVDATLVVFNNELGHLESGRVQEMQCAEGELDLQQLTAASRTLLGSDYKESSILLLLPPAEFVSSRETMPGVTRENLRSAINLQLENILPAYEATPAMAINTASADMGQEHLSLWIADFRLNEIFDAFAEAGMFIAAIRPRVLALKSEASSGIACDVDPRVSTAIELQDEVLTAWHQVNSLDLTEEQFAQQWQRTLEASGKKLVEYRDISSYLSHTDRDANPEYSFFPQGALNARKKIEKGRNYLIAAAAVVLLMFLASIPFIGQSLEFRRISSALATNLELSADARADQSVVVDFERDFGPIMDFPEQRVREAMFTLQNVLSPDQLASMEVEEGLIRIQGTSNDPQAILERLEQDPMFTEVVFSRATNNNRYYIDLRLSTVNFDAYMVRYFPDD